MHSKGSDVVGLAQTGSGKTAAFGLPMAERLMHGKGVRGLDPLPHSRNRASDAILSGCRRQDHQLRTACLIGGVKVWAAARGPE